MRPDTALQDFLASFGLLVWPMNCNISLPGHASKCGWLNPTMNFADTWNFAATWNFADAWKIVA
jgi:hypothetical protein